MKNFIRHIPVKQKLTVAIMAASLLVLSILSVFFVLTEIYSSQSFLEREMSALASTLGANARKLLLTGEHQQAGDILAGLERQPNIKAAFLFDEAGRPVANYQDRSDSRFLLQVVPQDFRQENLVFWTNSPTEQSLLSWNHLSLFQPIYHDQHRVGTIYLLNDLRHLHGRLYGVLFGVSLSAGLLLVLSWLLSGRLQRPVSEPLLELVGTMEQISDRKDYTLRARKAGRDEIGLLVDGFNHMLQQIEQHRAKMVRHQESLEETVEQRTAELRRIVAMLEVAKQQAEAASEAKSQFLANITHELRTPLIGVLGMNELLFRTSLNEQQHSFAQTVQQSGENLMDLINDVLDFSKIEAGEMKLTEEEFSLYQVVEDVVTLLSPSAEAKGLQLYADIERAATVKVRSDRTRIRQIVMNLVGNAIKFTDSGFVRVNLASRAVDQGKVTMDIDVTDTGIGMDKDAQEQVFSAFYQSDYSNTRQHGGTGLGLAIVRQLVDLLAGKIELESTPGKGSRFHVRLCFPLVEMAEFPLPKTLRDRQFVILEEDCVAREILEKRLAELQLQVISVVSSKDLNGQIDQLLQVGRLQPILILSTHVRSRENIQPTYQRVRQIKAYADLPRILLVSRSRTVELTGHEAQLSQPLKWQDLQAVLSRRWEESHPVRSVPHFVRTSETDPEKKASQAQLLFVGGSIASRELIRMAINDLTEKIDMAKNLEQATELIKQSAYRLLLVDMAGLDADNLISWCQSHFEKTPLCLFHGPTDDPSRLVPYAAVTLEKPIDRVRLQRFLQTVLTDDFEKDVDLRQGGGQ